MNLPSLQKQKLGILEALKSNNDVLIKIISGLNHDVLEPSKSSSQNDANTQLSRGLILDLNSIAQDISEETYRQSRLISRLENTLYSYSSEDDPCEVECKTELKSYNKY